MRAVIQRVCRASVTIQNRLQGRIENGLLVLLAVEDDDSAADIEWLSGKVVRLRVFPDAAGYMNRSILETGGDILVVSQFTLFASTRKGTKPSWHRAAPPEVALGLYERFVAALRATTARPVVEGKFGAAMEIDLTNDGPVTLILDS